MCVLGCLAVSCCSVLQLCSRTRLPLSQKSPLHGERAALRAFSECPIPHTEMHVAIGVPMPSPTAHPLERIASQLFHHKSQMRTA